MNARTIASVICPLLLLSSAAAAQPASAGRQTGEPPTQDPKVEMNARLGVKLPGEITPVNWFHSETKTAPFLGTDLAWILGRYFSIGPYVAVSLFSFDRMSGSKKIGEGNGFWVSGGLAAKGRLPVSDAFLLRAGLTLGANLVGYDGKRTDATGTFEMSGGGLQTGLDVDAVVRVSSQVGIVGQLAFLAQPIGTAAVKGYPTSITAEGADRKLGFSPIFVLSVGPELAF